MSFAMLLTVVGANAATTTTTLIAPDHEMFLEMPLLAMSGEFSAASYFTDHCKLVANNVSEVIIKGAGHWLVQENTPEVLKGLEDFFEK